MPEALAIAQQTDAAVTATPSKSTVSKDRNLHLENAIGFSGEFLVTEGRPVGSLDD